MWQAGPARICTSIVERSNCSLRRRTRRCTRLTNAFSKKWKTTGPRSRFGTRPLELLPEIHKPLRVTPAVAAGLQIMFGMLREMLKTL
jgi:hypothetical protein